MANEKTINSIIPAGPYKDKTYGYFLDYLFKNDNAFIKEVIANYNMNIIQISQLLPVEVPINVLSDYMVSHNIQKADDIKTSWTFENYDTPDGIHLKNDAIINEDIMRMFTKATNFRFFTKIGIDNDVVCKNEDDENLAEGPIAVCECCKTKNARLTIYADGNSNHRMVKSNNIYVCDDCYDKTMIEHRDSPFASVTKTFEFEYSHFLPMHDRKCKFLHGHRGQLEITVKRKSDRNGFVIDFSKLKSIVNEKIISKLDHNFVNLYMPIPTCENMLLWMWGELGDDIKGLESIKLYEQGDSFAILTKDDVLKYVDDMNVLNILMRMGEENEDEN